MSKLKNISIGEWNVIPTRSEDLKRGKFSVEGLHYKVGYFNNLDNAKLVADAGTTANKTGKLPSDLLKENEELKKCLKYFADNGHKVPNSEKLGKAIELFYK